MYLDDPSELLTPVEDAWRDYVAAGEVTYQQVADQVKEWRLAPFPWRYLPRHPLAHQFDVGDHSAWRPRPIRYIDANDDDTSVIRHGLDSEGRVIVAGNRIVIYHDGYQDILLCQRQKDSNTDELTDSYLVYEPERKTDFPKGRISRFIKNADGRIVQSVELSDEGHELQYHYRMVETFRWDGSRLIESFNQWFQRGREETDEDPSKVRRVNNRLWEPLYMRRRTEFSYDDDGRLAKVAEYTPEGKLKEVRYSYNPGDTVESLSDHLVKLLKSHIVKAIKAAKEAHPVRWAALQYSAEHAHCGLPTEVLLSNDEHINPLDWEAYQHRADWPPEGRVGQKYEDLQRRLQLVVEGLPEYEEDFQPRPYRDVLWRASRHVYDALSGKRVTATNFAIFPIDDHSDVDPCEDVRQSLPSGVAQQVIEHSNKS